jgi:hypothetical protein
MQEFVDMVCHRKVCLEELAKKMKRLALEKKMVHPTKPPVWVILLLWLLLVLLLLPDRLSTINQAVLPTKPPV